MDTVFKLISGSRHNLGEVHIWEWLSAPESIRLSDIKVAAIQLFSYPLESEISFTWFDGVDTISCSSDSELIYILKHHRKSCPNSSLDKALRLTVRNKSELHALHLDVQCDGCKGVVYGIRYKCLCCQNFDLCSFCFANNKHLAHPFCAVRYAPGQNKLMHTAYERCQHPAVEIDSPLGTISTVKVSPSTLSSIGTHTPREPTMHENSEWEVVSDASDFIIDNDERSLEENEISPKSEEKYSDVHYPASLEIDSQLAHAELMKPEILMSLVPNDEFDERNTPTSGFICEFKSPAENGKSAKRTSGENAPSETDNSKQIPSPIKNPEQSDRTEHRESYQLPNNIRQTEDVGSTLRGIFHEPVVFITDAWSNISSALSGSINPNALQVLLDAGYSDENGILSFLLNENNGSSNAVLEILRHQNL